MGIAELVSFGLGMFYLCVQLDVVLTLGMTGAMNEITHLPLRVRGNLKLSTVSLTFLFVIQYDLF